MLFHVGIENNNEGFRSIAWALEHPGCYAYGKDADAALAAFPAALRAYSGWINKHEPSWLHVQNVESSVDGVWNNYAVNDKFELVEPGEDGIAVESWFQYDWKPLTAEEIEQALKLLTWSRADLLKTIEGMSAEKLDQTYPGERWSINGILRHVGSAEWWYMDRLGRAFPKAELPKTHMERLEKVRRAFSELLPQLEGVKQVAGSEGEFWSPRKALRRALWHERDHTEHIHKLI
jgi:uncharacterized damage-inducible protein DinB